MKHISKFYDRVETFEPTVVSNRHYADIRKCNKCGLIQVHVDGKCVYCYPEYNIK